VWDASGAAVFAAGFCFEAVGDWQLRRFLRRPENSGRLMTEGLWAWTRHPNYFGEAALWWGIGFVAVQAEHGWAALASALTITVLVRFVSGVPLLEKKYAGREDFEAYKKRTSVFFPLPPRPPVAEKSKTDR
jgi:steroid 5-alpha reductase family enzyme